MFRLVILIVGIGIACLAYRESENFKRQTGVTPWRVPSWVWAIICFASFFLGAILLAVARRSTKPDQYPAGPYPGAPAFMPAQAFSPTPVPASPVPAAGWHRDPSGRFQLRYWDGLRWTEHVSTQGKAKIDPF